MQNPMIIEDLVNRVIVIDNREDEVKPLIEKLKEKDIDALFLPCNDTDTNFSKYKYKNRELIFVDLLLDEDVNNVSSNISRIKYILSQICHPDFGTYGLIVWTKHPEHITEIYAAFNKDKNATTTTKQPLEDEEEDVNDCAIAQLPLFILLLDKSVYIQNKWDTLLNDIQKQLEQNLSANFFLNWKHTVAIAENSTINKLYKLCGNYSVKDNRIQHILHEMAIKHIGTDEASNEIIARESYKAVDEILYSELFVQQKEEVIAPFPKIVDEQLNERSKDTALYAHLNACIFIDETNLDQNIILSGNIYEVIDEQSPLRLSLTDCFNKKCPEKYRYIAIELTPPCDAMNKRKGYRLVGGILFNIKNQNGDTCKCNTPGEKQYYLKYLRFDNDVCSMVLDFRYLYCPSEKDLKNTRKYKLIAKSKPQLFADVLQKFSSHASRLGIPDFQ